LSSSSLSTSGDLIDVAKNGARRRQRDELAGHVALRDALQRATHAHGPCSGAALSGSERRQTLLTTWHRVRRTAMKVLGTDAPDPEPQRAYDLDELHQAFMASRETIYAGSSEIQRNIIWRTGPAS
jgi:hypothetical protein